MVFSLLKNTNNLPFIFVATATAAFCWLSTPSSAFWIPTQKISKSSSSCFSTGRLYYSSNQNIGYYNNENNDLSYYNNDGQPQQQQQQQQYQYQNPTQQQQQQQNHGQGQEVGGDDENNNISQTYMDFCNYYNKQPTEEGFATFQRNFVMLREYYERTGIAIEMDGNADRIEMIVPDDNYGNDNKNNSNMYNNRQQQEPQEYYDYNSQQQQQQQQQQSDSYSSQSQLEPYEKRNDEDDGKVYVPQPLRRRQRSGTDDLFGPDDMFADFFEEADRMFNDDNFFGGGSGGGGGSLLSPFFGGSRSRSRDGDREGNRRSRSLLSPFGMMDSSLMKPFWSNMDEMMKNQQDSIQPLLQEAEWILNEDKACTKALGGSIKVGPVLSSRTSSSNMNGQTTRNTQLQVSVQGSQNVGTIKLSASENGIEQLVVQVKNQMGGEIDVQVPNNSSGRKGDTRPSQVNPNSSKQQNRRSNPMDPSNPGFIDAEVIDI